MGLIKLHVHNADTDELRQGLKEPHEVQSKRREAKKNWERFNSRADVISMHHGKFREEREKNMVGFLKLTQELAMKILTKSAICLSLSMNPKSGISIDWESTY